MCLCVLLLARSGGPASRTRSGAPHHFLWPSCPSSLFGLQRAGVPHALGGRRTVRETGRVTDRFPTRQTTAAHAAQKPKPEGPTRNNPIARPRTGTTRRKPGAYATAGVSGRHHEPGFHEPPGWGKEPQKRGKPTGAPLNSYGGHEERSSEGSGSDAQEGNDSCSSSADGRNGKDDSRNDSENASLPSLQVSSTNTNSSTQFPEYENTTQADYDCMGGNTRLFFERPSKTTSHPKASIDSTNLPAPHQFDMKDPKVLLRLKTLLNNRPRSQQAMAKAWSRTASDFNIKSTTQLNAQAGIKWINEFENIRRKEPGLIKKLAGASRSTLDWAN